VAEAAPGAARALPALTPGPGDERALRHWMMCNAIVEVSNAVGVCIDGRHIIG